MVMWFVIFLAALLVVILVAVSQAPPGAERGRTPARPKAARPATARPRQTRTSPPFRGRAPAQGGLPPQGGLPDQNGLPVRGATQAPGCPCPGACPRGCGTRCRRPAEVPPPPAVPAGPMFQSALPAPSAVEPSAGGLLNPAASPGYGPPFPPAPPPTSVLDPGGAAGPGPGYVARHHSPPAGPAGTYAPSLGGLSVTPPPVAGRPPWEPAPQPPEARLARFRGTRPPGDVSGRCACS